MTTATANDWLRFLRPVALAVRNTPSEDDAKGRAAALAFALCVPPSALTEARQRELCRKCEFWPSIAEIEALFAQHWRDMARSRAIATSGGLQPLPAPRHEPMTDEQRAECLAKSAALKAELAGMRVAADRPARQPCTLSPMALAAAYEAAGTGPALFRAQQLRRMLDGEA